MRHWVSRQPGPFKPASIDDITNVLYKCCEIICGCSIPVNPSTQVQVLHGSPVGIACPFTYSWPFSKQISTSFSSDEWSSVIVQMLTTIKRFSLISAKGILKKKMHKYQLTTLIRRAARIGFRDEFTSVFPFSGGIDYWAFHVTAFNGCSILTKIRNQHN